MRNARRGELRSGASSGSRRSAAAAGFRLRPFRPSPWLPGPHLQTLGGKLLRSSDGPTVRRIRVDTPDGDFLDLDLGPEPATGGRAPVVLVLHGLEGSSERAYVREAYRRLLERGLRPAGMNFRGCSGEPNRKARFYHSGETDDLGFVLDWLRDRFPGRPLGALGFSLGGNMLLKYLGEEGEGAGQERQREEDRGGEEGEGTSQEGQGSGRELQGGGREGQREDERGGEEGNGRGGEEGNGRSGEGGNGRSGEGRGAGGGEGGSAGGDGGGRPLAASVAVSVPFDLAAGADRLEEGPMGSLYTHYFLRMLRRKIRDKSSLLDGRVEVEKAVRASTLRAFDDAATAPLHGFEGAAEYYAACSSARFLSGIRLPTLLVQARDDPFLPEECLPLRAIRDNPSLVPAITASGGHVGFVEGPPWDPRFWAEEQAARFLALHLHGNAPEAGS